MARSKAKTWGLIALLVILALIVGGIIGFRIAAGILKGKVVEVLGPGSEVKEIQVGWSGVELHGLRIKGARGWPTTDALRAEGVGTLGRKGVEAAGEAAKGLGGALQQLFGGKRR